MFIDGHERSDVVKSRVEFLRTMTACGFLRPDNAPTEEAAQALPPDVPHMSKEDGEKRICGFMTRVHITYSNTMGGERKTAYQAKGERYVNHGL